MDDFGISKIHSPLPSTTEVVQITESLDILILFKSSSLSKFHQFEANIGVRRRMENYFFMESHIRVNLLPALWKCKCQVLTDVSGYHINSLNKQKFSFWRFQY